MNTGKVRLATLPTMVALLTALLVGAAAFAQEDIWDPFEPAGPSKPGETTKPAEPSELPARPQTPVEAALSKKIDQMVEFYLEMYGKHLQRGDWITRAMAVISLSRMDDPRVTAKLLEVLAGDAHKAVRVYAWEALHARNGSLGEPQRQQWLSAGMGLAERGLMRGDLRVGLLGAMAATAPTPAARRLFMQFFATTNSLDPDDIPTLAAMRQALAKWRDGELIKALVVEMDKLDNAYRAEYVLAGLNSGVPAAMTHQRDGSEAMWKQTQLAWAEWFKKTHPADKADEKLQPYAGQSALLAPPEKIADPADPKWRKDLELGRLSLDQLDVTFAVDSTGSMIQVVEWVKRDVLKMMRSFGAISREPRIGVVFYRDHGDEYVVQLHSLTDRGDELEQAIRGATAKGGADVPEAVYEALATAATKQKWSSGDRARKVIVLVGDAPPHENTLEEIDKLVDAAAAKGFRFHCIKARTAWGGADLSSFDRIAEHGKGKSFWVNFPAVAADGTGRTGIASPRVSGDPHRQIVGEVLKSILTEAYHDRAEPFVNVLLECLKDHVPEKRMAFGPAPPPQPRQRTEPERQPRRPTPPPKPYDPQER